MTRDGERFARKVTFRSPLSRRAGPVPARGRRRRAVGPRQRGRGRRRSLGAALGAGTRRRRPPAAGAREDRARRCRHAAPATSRSRARSRSAAGARTVRCARRAGASLGRQARRPLVLGCTPATSRRLDGTPRRGDWIEASRSSTPRMGREVGPSTPVVGRAARRAVHGDAPLRVLRADAEIGLTRYHFETRTRIAARCASRSTPRARRSSASPTTTPTASRPGATTARSPRCAPGSGTAARRGRPLAAARDAAVARAARTSSTPSARRWRRAGARVSAEPAPPGPSPGSDQIAIDLPGGQVAASRRAGGGAGAASRRGSSLALRERGAVPARALGRRITRSTRRASRVVAAGELVARDADRLGRDRDSRRDVACVVRTADCVPIALVAPEAVAMLHGGWRGLAAGIVADGAARAGRRSARARSARRSGRTRGVCCYEAGDEVHAAFADLGPGARRGRHADLEAVARALLRAEGVGEVHARGSARSARARAAVVASPRGRARRAAGRARVAELIHGLDAERVRANLAAVRAEIAAACARAGRDPADVELLAAVQVRRRSTSSACSPTPGITLVGENRAQDLVAKAERFGDAPDVRLHRPSAEPQGRGRCCRTCAGSTPSRATRCSTQLGRHGTPETEVLVEVNVAGEEARAASRPAELGAFIARCPVPRRRPDDDAAARRGPAGRAAGGSRALADLARERGLEQLSMGTTQDFAVAVEEGATIVRIGTRLYD